MVSWWPERIYITFLYLESEFYCWKKNWTSFNLALLYYSWGPNSLSVLATRKNNWSLDILVTCPQHPHIIISLLSLSLMGMWRAWKCSVKDVRGRIWVNPFSLLDMSIKSKLRSVNWESSWAKKPQQLVDF